jgi:hypothetical protein
MDQKLQLGKPAYQLFQLCDDAVVRFNLLANRNYADGTDDSAQKAATGARSKALPAHVNAKKPDDAVKLDAFAARRRI